MIAQAELDFLRMVATRALEHTPGPRSAHPEAPQVWDQHRVIYKAATADIGPYELEFAAVAQNALLPLLDDLQAHIDLDRARNKQALRGEGGNTHGDKAAELPVTPRPPALANTPQPPRKPRKAAK